MVDVCCYWVKMKFGDVLLIDLWWYVWVICEILWCYGWWGLFLLVSGVCLWWVVFWLLDVFFGDCWNLLLYDGLIGVFCIFGIGWNFEMDECRIGFICVCYVGNWLFWRCVVWRCVCWYLFLFWLFWFLDWVGWFIFVSLWWFYLCVCFLVRKFLDNKKFCCVFGMLIFW